MMKGISLPFKYLVYVIMLISLLLLTFFLVFFAREKFLSIVKFIFP
ncbi:MAG: hypothetical protein QXI23_02765 [Candidatus Aenigmatarchaeota archaeon]